MKNTISFNDFIVLLNKYDEKNDAIPFSLKFITADKKRNIGGEIIEIEKAIKCVGKKDNKIIYCTSVKDLTLNKKNPHHKENKTMNIYILGSQQIRKIHPRLCLEINGLKIIP
jgi:hypothetical protein